MNIFFFIPNVRTLFWALLTLMFLSDGAARIFPTTLCRGAGIWTHVTLVSRVAPIWDLLKDGLPTELPRHGKYFEHEPMYVG